MLAIRDNEMQEEIPVVSKTTRDLEKWLAEHEATLHELQKKIEGLRFALEVSHENDEREVSQATEAAPAKQLRNAMVDILREAGVPLHYTEIGKRLIDRGVTVPGKNPSRNVNAHLSNDDRFDRRGGGEWGLASWRDTPPPRSVVSLRDRVRSGGYQTVVPIQTEDADELSEVPF